jgi:hypothetical protein
VIKVFFLEAVCDSEAESETELSFVDHPTPKISTNMAAKMSPDELQELGKAIANIIKEQLLSEVRTEIHNIFLRERERTGEEIKMLRAENDALRASLKSNQLQIDELEQYGRRMCLDVTGIQGDTGEASENVESKLLDKISKVKLPNGQKLNITSKDIDRCHRKGKFQDGKGNRKVIVKFTNSKARQALYENRKLLGAGIFVQENITKFREQLAFEARELVRSKKLTKTWIAGCNVYASIKIGESDETKIKIRDLGTIQNIKDGKLLAV